MRATIGGARLLEKRYGRERCRSTSIASRRPLRGRAPYTSAAGAREYEYIFTPLMRPDGTVEAETDEGWMRFENLEHLDEYLEVMAPAAKA